MPFLTDPLSRQLPKKRWWHKQRWMLVEPLIYSDEIRTIEVPAGFVHDYASIPRLFWPMLSPTGSYSRSAVLHDFTGDDELFYQTMLEDGTPAWLAKLMYMAVAGNKDQEPKIEIKTIND